MYCALLVDDEELDLYGLRHFIPWEQLGIAVSASVNSGYAAMSVLEREQIDILVTDIRMPNMSGLELAKKAKTLWPDLRIIFVSGVEDFHYAREALALNAVSYVLKPVDDDELTRTIEQVKDSLDTARENVRMESVYKELAPMARKQWLLDALEGMSLSSEAGFEYERNAELSKLPGKIAVLEIDDVAWKLSKLSDMEREKLLSDCLEYLAEQAKIAGVANCCRIAPHRMACILENADDASYEWLTSAIIGLSERHPVTATAGVGELFEAYADMKRSYKEALKALSCKWFEGKNRVIELGRIEHAELEHARHVDIGLDTLFEALSRCDALSIEEEAGGVFSFVRRLDSKQDVDNFLARALFKLELYLEGLNVDFQDHWGKAADHWEAITSYETIADVQEWFISKLKAISDVLLVKKQRKNRQLIEKVMAFVESRVGEQLTTLRDVSDHFSYSHNYMGQLFREETGRSFTDFIIHVRLEKACELLKHSSLKIYEISDHVGYSNLTYFSKQFKESFGLSPGEYRKTCR
ncbi:response regulator [Paenibacillus sp. YIM B09110]|uniref:response regulator n=1 Tax=Paenibacillus sp. YIM B09110 TaxID=3126102 RepID=UPI00301D55DD